MNQSAWLRNAKEIGEYVGVSKDGIKVLVETEGLPAKKFFRKWRALKADVDRWAKEKMRN